MARVVVVYAHAPRRYERRLPLAVLAEDEGGVFIAPVWKPAELAGLRRLLERGEQDYHFWVAPDVVGQVGEDHPLHARRSIPFPGQPTHRQLEFFTRMSLSEKMVDQHHYGLIREVPGPAGVTATQLASILAEAWPDVARAATGDEPGASGGK